MATPPVVNVPKAVPSVKKDSSGNIIPELRNYEGLIKGSEIATAFNDLVKDKEYFLGAKGIGNYTTAKGGSTTSVDSIDCSGAVCTVKNTQGKDYDLTTTNAAKFKTLAKLTEISLENTVDGDLVLMKVDGKGIDHIGIVAVDENGYRYLAESSSTYNGTTITPFEERIEDLTKRKSNFSYEIVSDKDQDRNIIKYSKIPPEAEGSSKTSPIEFDEFGNII